MKILHVEEAPDGRDLVRRILSEAGHRLLGAVDGSEGIEVALREQPDLILLDLGLPGVDGCEVGAAMRLFPALQSPVIVVIVPVSEARSHEERVFAAGCNGYVTKPIDPDRLAQQIERFQRARREWVDPGRPAPLLRDLHRGIVQKLLGQVQEQKRALREGLGRQAEDLGHTAAQLLQSAKLAAIREVAAEVAHEINNPMTSILGYATLLYEETSAESPRKETLRLIQSESLRIREIVRTLLDFSGRRSLSLATGPDPCPSAVDAR